MDELPRLLNNLSKDPIVILDTTIPVEKYVRLDLSISNGELNKIDLGNHLECQHYIDKVLSLANAQVAYGGYLEQRPLYADNPAFKTGGVQRNIHLGIDFWTKADTTLMAPLDGKVHSFKNNSTFGDYGPTIILQHEIGNLAFFTLYGHLSLESLEELYLGKVFKKGEALATLGTPDVNVGYAPHLHFQIIQNIADYFGDYPGVCTEQELEFYSKNCPNPDLLLKIRP